MRTRCDYTKQILRRIKAYRPRQKPLILMICGHFMTTPNLRRTPFFELHKKLGARLVPFSGYEMPVQYSGLIQEHQGVRNACGVFDVAHMGLVKISGKDARTFLNHSLTRNFSNLNAGKGAYTLLCRENGNTVDDLIVYCQSETLFYAVLNAGNKEKDLAYLKTLSTGFDVHFEALFDSYALLALQGPLTWKILLENCQLDAPFRSNPEAFSFWHEAKLFSTPVLIAVTGYTGETGCEIAIPSHQAAEVLEKLLEKGKSSGLIPAGLGARDTLRTEMGYSLYGHELSEDINPIEAGLSWAVSFKKENFVGKQALLAAKENPKRKLICLKNQSKQAPRAEMLIKDAAGQTLGQITSGTFAPSLGYVIGMALVKSESQAPYFVDIRGTLVPFELCQRPFYSKTKES